MSINWKLRLKNGTTLMALIVAVVGGVYSVLTALGITPAVDQGAAMALASSVVTVLVALGIVTDPTTKGLGDSAQALTYTEPKATEGAVDTAHTSEGV
jgi:phi LC3 family holin